MFSLRIWLVGVLLSSGLWSFPALAIDEWAQCLSENEEAAAIGSEGRGKDKRSGAVKSRSQRKDKSDDFGIRRLRLLSQGKKWNLQIDRLNGSVEVLQILNPSNELRKGRWQGIIAGKSLKSKDSRIGEAVLLTIDRSEKTAKLAYKESVYIFDCQITKKLTEDESGETATGVKESVGSRHNIELPDVQEGGVSLEGETPFEAGYCVEKISLDKALTIEDCQGFRKQVPTEEKCFGDRAMAEIEALITQCYEKMVDAEYRQRMSRLKGQDQQLYASETQQQADFVALREELCGAYKKCSGFWAESAYSNCQAQLNGFRFRMIRALNSKKLVFKSRGLESKVWSPKVMSFAEAICRLPANHWVDQKIPKDCTSHILGEIASFNGVPLPGSDPCGEE